MNERDMIINLLLQSCDHKNLTIQKLQARVAELEKKYEPREPSKAVPPEVMDVIKRAAEKVNQGT